MIAGDWPNGTARNLIKSPPETPGRARARALSMVPTCTRVVHGERVQQMHREYAPVSPQISSPARADTTRSRACALEFSGCLGNSRGANLDRNRISAILP